MMYLTNKEFFELCAKYKSKINPLGALIQCSWETKYKGKTFNSPLWLNANNPAGIKSLKGWKGDYIDSATWEESKETVEQGKKTFIKFNSIDDGIKGYVDKISQNYPNSVNNVDNIFGYLAGLLNGKYKWATDSSYLTKLTDNLISISPEIFGDNWQNKLKTSLDYAISKGKITDKEADIFNKSLNKIGIKNVEVKKTIQYKICIDPGHGLPDTGAKGALGDLEMDIALSVSKLLKTELENEKMKVKMTRTTKNAISANKGADLKARCSISDDFGADVFISIHCNSSSDRNSNGFEAFTSVAENKSDILCDILYKHWRMSFPNMKIRTNTVNGKEGKDADLYVVKNTKANSVLVELAFINNLKENAMLIDPEFQLKAAKTIKDTILEFLNT